MCPDRQFLSVYFDGELPSPWKERMEQHLETCSVCRENLARYKEISGSLSGVVADECAAMNAAKTQIWEKVGVFEGGQPVAGNRRLSRFMPAMRIPAAFASALAGAAVAAAIVCVIWLVSPARNNGMAQSALSNSSENFAGIAVSSDYELNLPDITPVSNMNEVLRYLEDDDSSNIVIIKLPERKKFNRYGDPAFINAADYNRRAKN